MKSVMNGMVNVDGVKSLVELVAMSDVENPLRITKKCKVSGPSRTSLHRKQVLLQIASETLDEKDEIHDWKTKTVVPIYKKSVVNCASYRISKIFEHGIKRGKGL